MKSKHLIRWVLLLTAIGVLLVFSVIFASGGYSLSWYSVDGGGATFLSGDGYELGSSAGQPDAGAASGDGYTLRSGFWPGAVQSPTPTPTLPPGVTPTPTNTPAPSGDTFVYLPLILR